MAKLSPKLRSIELPGVKDAIDLTVLVKNLLSIVGTVGPVLLALVGVTTTQIGGASVGFDFSQSSLAIRLFVFAAISGGLGLSLALYLAWLGKHRSEGALFFGHLLALMLAMLMIGSADWLARQGQGVVMQLQYLFTAFGFGIAFALLTFRLRARVAYRGPHLLLAQSKVILTFASTGFLVLLLLELWR